MSQERIYIEDIKALRHSAQNHLHPSWLFGELIRLGIPIQFATDGTLSSQKMMSRPFVKEKRDIAIQDALLYITSRIHHSQFNFDQMRIAKRSV